MKLYVSTLGIILIIVVVIVLLGGGFGVTGVHLGHGSIGLGTIALIVLIWLVLSGRL